MGNEVVVAIVWDAVDDWIERGLYRADQSDLIWVQQTHANLGVAKDIVIEEKMDGLVHADHQPALSITPPTVSRIGS
jgi:hypothetical protein